MVHLRTSTVLETITPTTGKPSTCPATSLATNPMLLPSSGVTDAGWAPRLPSARLLSRLRVTPLALRISASEPQVSSLSAKSTPPWTSTRACCSCALCRWSWFLQRRKYAASFPGYRFVPTGMECSWRSSPALDVEVLQAVQQRQAVRFHSTGITSRKCSHLIGCCIHPRLQSLLGFFHLLPEGK